MAEQQQQLEVGDLRFQTDINRGSDMACVRSPADRIHIPVFALKKLMFFLGVHHEMYRKNYKLMPKYILT